MDITSIKKIHERASEESRIKWTNLVKKEADDSFKNYPNVLCIFQTHNKSHLIKDVLSPFHDNKLQNIILFADGCSDDTVQQAQPMLEGKKHSIIVLNDLHEIHNYRFAISSAWGLTSEFALLMQDDDLYPNDFGWLDYGLEMMKKDPKLCVIGYRDGINFQKISPASDSFETDLFYVQGDKMGLPGSSEVSLVSSFKPLNGFNFQYCQTVNRAPHLIRVESFLKYTDLDELFEPFQDDDTNYCLQLWSQGMRVGLVSGANIARDIGIGGMRLSGHLTPSKRPAHTKRNHNLLFERFSTFINSGELSQQVALANKEIVRKYLYL